MPEAGIKLELSALARISQEAQNAALETVGALRGEIVSAQVIPKDYGTLEASVGAVAQFTKGEEIHTTLGLGDTAYARRLYFHPEYNFQTVNNANAQGKWAAPWLPGGDLEGFIPDTYHERLKARIGK